ncbi:GntR family transcriptional regulator [Gorillibacterium massiliense]|uniref:GntR family transcriptional regulator n=1 Tax=Gorillibacterium massiliense TaxID=1280390 RepID=UPI0004ACCAAA|nr:GntR family transcriptional regulator [Gorillibacterium massiliense]
MRVPIRISTESAEPMYHQIKQQLRALIISNELPEGTLLPSIRELAGDLACSAITIRRVYQDLENEGMIRTKQGAGTFVAGVAPEEREQHRMTKLRDTFRQAVEEGHRLNCSDDEMREMLERLLMEERQ